VIEKPLKTTFSGFRALLQTTFYETKTTSALCQAYWLDRLDVVHMFSLPHRKSSAGEQQWVQSSLRNSNVRKWSEWQTTFRFFSSCNQQTRDHRKKFFFYRVQRPFAVFCSLANFCDAPTFCLLMGSYEQRWTELLSNTFGNFAFRYCTEFIKTYCFRL